MVVNQAITGMGGLGKTQLAVEFAYRYGRYYRGVHWLDLADPSLLDSEIAQCGAQMSLADFPTDQPTQVALTLNTWKADGPRLLVLDNFEAVEQVGDVLTRLRHSSLHLLVTSRRTDWTPASGLRPLPLELFTPQESLAFLVKALEKRKDTDADLKILAERLGHLPLALELASRYLNGHARLTITEYLTQLQGAFDHPSMRDWRKDHPAATQHDLDLGHTFALSWEAIKDETTQKLFLTAGYLAPNSAIPLEIFEKALKIISDTCDEALDILYSLGLLRKSEGNLPTIHPLLAEYACDLAKEKNEILENLADVLGTLSSEVLDTQLPSHFIFLRSHMPVTASHAEEAGLHDAGTLWNNYGYYLDSVADYSNARIAYEHALKIDPNNTTYINNLGMVMKTSGDLDSARTMYESALKIIDKQLGENHPNTATLVNNLGRVMQDSGDLDSARTMFKRAIKIWEVNFGIEHPQVAIGINNLGTVMQNSGDLDGARTMFERARKINEASFGPDHPSVARDLNNLGEIMRGQGDLDGAHKIFERARKIFENQFGEEHPYVAILVNNMGMVMQDSGDLTGARRMFERAIKIDEALFGFDHPNVAVDINNLASVLQASGDLTGARRMYERALVILKNFLPPDHSDIKIVQGNLDSLNDLQG